MTQAKLSPPPPLQIAWQYSYGSASSTPQTPSSAHPRDAKNSGCWRPWRHRGHPFSVCQRGDRGVYKHRERKMQKQKLKEWRRTVFLPHLPLEFVFWYTKKEFNTTTLQQPSCKHTTHKITYHAGQWHMVMKGLLTCMLISTGQLWSCCPNNYMCDRDKQTDIDRQTDRQWAGAVCCWSVEGKSPVVVYWQFGAHMTHM